jgi:DeoR/GlpR family transcriptional regulator of sugar metabolism
MESGCQKKSKKKLDWDFPLEVTVRRKGEELLENKIFALLREGGRFTQALLKDKFGATVGGISKAVKKLLNNGKVVEYEIEGRTWYELPSPAVTIWQIRLGDNPELKRTISKRVFELIVGASEEDKTQKQFATTRENLLEQVPNTMQSVLRSVYSDHERTVIIDGGTTNYYVAERLKSISLPSERFGVWRLLVFTNCPPIAERLSEAPTGPRVTLIGGRVSRNTRSISGHFAETSIAAWNVMADFSIIGATGVDLRRGCCSYSEEEGVVKTMLLNRGRIKCIVMDSAKIKESGSHHITFSFAPVIAETVNILISDVGMWQYEKFCKEVQSRGIGILT